MEWSRPLNSLRQTKSRSEKMDFCLAFTVRKIAQKYSKNEEFAKFSKIDFLIMVQDMNTGVRSNENTSLGHILKHLRHIYQTNSKKKNMHLKVVI